MTDAQTPAPPAPPAPVAETTAAPAQAPPPPPPAPAPVAEAPTPPAPPTPEATSDEANVGNQSVEPTQPPAPPVAESTQPPAPPAPVAADAAPVATPDSAPVPAPVAEQPQPAPAAPDPAPVQGEVVDAPAAPDPAPVATVPAPAPVAVAEVESAPAVAPEVPAAQPPAVIEQPPYNPPAEVVVRTNGGPVAPLEGFSDVEIAEMQQLAQEATQVVDTSDLRLSQFAIVQATSKAVQEQGATPGKIVNTLTGEQFDELEFVVSFIKKTRTRFGAKIGDPPRCSSPNALDGYGDMGDALVAQGALGPNGGGACARCPEAVVDFKNRKFGDCALQFNFIGFPLNENVDPSFAMPLVIQMQRTSIQSAQNLSTLLASFRFPWSTRVKISTKAKSNDSGSFYTWQVAKGGDTSPEEQRRAFEIARLVRNADNVSVEQSDVGDVVEVVGSDGGSFGGQPTAADDGVPF